MKKPPVNLGSFDKSEALAIQGTLSMHLGILATVTNLLVGDNEPTMWWLVDVAAKDEKLAQAYLKGWRVSRIFQRIEDQPGNAVLYPEYAAFFPEVS